MWKSKTNTGRVVYDRAPTQFSCADYRRIGRKIASRALSEPGSERTELLRCLGVASVELLTGVLFNLEMIEGADNPVIQALRDLLELMDNDWEGYGGGGFGGAGASRDFREE